MDVYLVSSDIYAVKYSYLRWRVAGKQRIRKYWCVYLKDLSNHLHGSKVKSIIYSSPWVFCEVLPHRCQSCFRRITTLVLLFTFAFLLKILIKYKYLDIMSYEIIRIVVIFKKLVVEVLVNSQVKWGLIVCL